MILQHLPVNLASPGAHYQHTLPQYLKLLMWSEFINVDALDTFILKGEYIYKIDVNGKMPFVSGNTINCGEVMVRAFLCACFCMCAIMCVDSMCARMWVDFNDHLLNWGKI